MFCDDLLLAFVMQECNECVTEAASSCPCSLDHPLASYDSATFLYQLSFSFSTLALSNSNQCEDIRYPRIFLTLCGKRQIYFKA